MPAKDCIRSDQSRHFLQQFPAKLLSLGREAAALLVVQVERAAQLLAENAVLLLQLVEDLLLLPVEPTRQEADKENMWRDEQVHRKHGSRSHLRLQDAASRVSAAYGQNDDLRSLNAHIEFLLRRALAEAGRLEKKSERKQ